MSDANIMNMGYRKNIKKQTGFTMIEIIAILLIISIVAVIAISRVTSTKIYNVASEVEILKANLRHAQSRALSNADTTFGSTKNATWGILLSTTSFTLQTNGTTSSRNLPNENSPTHTLPSGISITSSSSPVTYDIWGKPVDATTGNAVASNIVITVTDGKSPQTFNIIPTTGFIQ